MSKDIFKSINPKNFIIFFHSKTMKETDYGHVVEIPYTIVDNSIRKDIPLIVILMEDRGNEQSDYMVLRKKAFKDFSRRVTVKMSHITFKSTDIPTIVTLDSLLTTKKECVTSIDKEIKTLLNE